MLPWKTRKDFSTFNMRFLGINNNFKLVVLPAQQEIDWNELKDCKKTSDTIKCLVFVEDISQRKKVILVSVVNDAEYDRVPFFLLYITRMVYLRWCNPFIVPMLGVNVLVDFLILSMFLCYEE